MIPDGTIDTSLDRTEKERETVEDDNDEDEEGTRGTCKSSDTAAGAAGAVAAAGMAGWLTDEKQKAGEGRIFVQGPTSSREGVQGGTC